MKYKSYDIKKFFFRQPIWFFIKWVIISTIIGISAGIAAIAFHFVLQWCAQTRNQYNYFIFLLPLGGVAIAWLYKYLGDGDKGTNMVLSAIRSNKQIKAITAPLIFVTTAITHLFGGSAGREGAALQLGGSVATTVGKMFHLDEKDRRVVVMCGTSAAFAALFGTPITAAIFSLEVISVGVMYYSAIVPCSIAALCGTLLAGAFGIHTTTFVIAGIPEISVVAVLQVLLIGAICACVSFLFCNVMIRVSSFLKTKLPNVYVRSAVGGIIIILLTLAVGNQTYNGAGMDVVEKALNGNAMIYDFALKIIFTIITLGSGFKGGEIVPSFFIGSTLGCVAGGIIGLNPSFGAAIGLIAFFCGVTNCPITSFLLGIEMFGAKALPLGALAVATSYMLSGYSGLYGEQKIVYSKLKAEFIDIKSGSKKSV